MTAAGHGRSRGFTLPELVTVLVIVGILAAFALPRLFRSGSFEARGFAAEARAAVAFAQKLAIGSGCDVRVVFNAGGYSIERWPACRPADHSTATSPVDAPAGGQLTGTAPDGLGVGSVNFFYDHIGRPRQASAAAPLLAAAVQVQLGGRTLRIEPDTGYAREL